MLYYKANSNRTSQFQTYVEILENNQVCKGALNKEAIHHIHSIYDHAQRLSALSDHFDLNYYLKDDCIYCDLVKGTSLSEVLVKMLQQNQFKEMVECMNSYFKIILDTLPTVEYAQSNHLIFSKFTYDEKEEYTNVANLDFNFDNIFVTEDDFKVIDCEWCFDTIIPKSFLIYRSLLYFYTKYSSQLLKYKTYDEWLKLFNIQKGKEYFKIEDVFQQYIYGENRNANYLDQVFDRNRNLRQKKLYESFTQLYIDHNDGYNESESKIIQLEGIYQDLTFELNQYVHEIRLDLLNYQALFTVHKIVIYTDDGTKNIPLSKCITNGYVVENRLLYLVDDPMLLITVDQEINSIEVEFNIETDKNNVDFYMKANALLEAYRATLFDSIRDISTKLNEANIELIARRQHPIKMMMKKG